MTESLQLNLNASPEEVREQLQRLDRSQRIAIMRQAKADASRADFPAFVKYFHNWQWEPHHREWWDIVQTHKKACILAPPGTGKTRFFTNYVQWKSGHRPDIAWAYLQNTLSQASQAVSTIGDVLKSAEYRNIFPEIIPTERWSGSSLYVDRKGYRKEFRKEATVGAYGIPGNYQGIHIEGLIIDDPTDQEDVLSPTVMATQKNQLKGVIIDRIDDAFTANDPDASFYIIMTRWGNNDLLSTIEEDLKIPVFRYPARRDKSDPYPWGSHLLSQAYSDEMLDELQATKGDLFTLAYQCTTVGTTAGARVFPHLTTKKKWQKWLAKDDNELYAAPVKKRSLGVDWGTSTAHESAMVICYKLANEMVLIKAAWHSPSGSSDELLAKATEWKYNFGIRNAYIDRSQASLKEVFTRYGIDGWKGESSVEMRIGALRTLLETNRIVFDMDGPGVSDLYDALEGYSRDANGRVIEQNDDLVDACLYALSSMIDQRKIGLGPRVEIMPRGNDQPMADPYHDNFDPSDWDEEGTVRKNRRMSDYSSLL